jgi:hypothetical protein
MVDTLANSFNCASHFRQAVCKVLAEERAALGSLLQFHLDFDSFVSPQGRLYGRVRSRSENGPKALPILF